MERKYRKKASLVNKTGYTPGYSTEKNPVNFIPSENITMANTPYPLHATPLDQNGNPIGSSVVMQPGEEYRFGGASYVAETPMFGKGGEKNDWISAKIATLIREGYKRDQAAAIAYNMYENIHANGGYQLPKYEDGLDGTDTEKPPGFWERAGNWLTKELTKPLGQDGNELPNAKYDGSHWNTPAKAPVKPVVPAPVKPTIAKPVAPAKKSILTPKNTPTVTPAVQPAQPTDVTPSEQPTDYYKNNPAAPTQEWADKQNSDFYGDYVQGDMNLDGVVDDKDKTDKFGNDISTEKPQIETSQPYQFFNPYAGVDIPTAAVSLGQSIENKDTFGMVASGAKVLAGTARNIFGGMGQANRNNYGKQQEAELQRKGMTGQGREVMAKFGGYYQDGGIEEGLEGQTSNPQEEQMEQQGGGQEQQIMQEVAQMLQQGASPQEIIQQLVQMGMPQEQATQTVQQVAQQMQGNTPQLKKGGSYYQDGGEQQMVEQVSQALQQGAQPQQVMQMLLKSGMSQDQAVQLIQSVMQQIQQQGHNPQEEATEGGQENPQEEAMEQGTPQLKFGGNKYQEGGEQPQQDGQMQAVMQQVMQMLQQGADPQQILQQLVQAGVPQEQAQQVVQAAMQQIQAQGHNPQEESMEGQQSNPQEEQMEQGTPQMKSGGAYYLNMLKGKTIKDYTLNKATGKYEVSYE